MKTIVVLLLALLALVGCAAEVEPSPAPAPAPEPFGVTAKFQGGTAMWIERMPCAKPTCSVEHGRVTSTDLAQDGAFTCNAAIDPGQTLVMTLACPRDLQE